MKWIKQFTIILFICLAAEIIKYFIPLPIPASIYGLVLMLGGLMTKIIPLSAVEETGTFLVEIMPLVFIPAGVGLLDAWGVLKPVIVPVAVIILVSTIFVTVAAGGVAQWIIRLEKRKKVKP